MSDSFLPTSVASGSTPNMFSAPPPPKAQLLPSLIMPDTPPASPVFQSLRPGNAFAQWGSSPPSSPALSQDAWSSDVESDAGMSDCEGPAGNGFQRALHGGNDSEIPDGLRTPKGHPLAGHKRLGKKGKFGLGLGLARFGLNLGGPKEEVLTEEEVKFQAREKRGSVGSTERSPFFANAKPAWQMPKIRVSKRSRPALYAVALLMVFLVYFSTHGRTPTSRPRSSLPHRRHVYPVNADDDIILGGAPSHNRPVAAAHKRRAAATKSVSPSARAANFQWAGKDMELAGLLSFMVASDANTIPNYDSAATLDPYLVLDFDPVSSHAAKDLKDMRTALWRDHPVIMLSRTRNAHSRFIKSTLQDLYIHPAPYVMDIDERPDADILDSLFQRLMGQSELPILLVGGEVVGGWADVDRLSQMSALKPLISSHGAFFAPPKNKKKKKSGHGGKSEEQLKKELEAAKKADELKRREIALEREELRLQEIALDQKEVVPVEDLSDPETF